MRYAWTPKFQLSGPTVHSYTVTLHFKIFTGEDAPGLPYDAPGYAARRAD